jgi:hypothetical protein
VNRVQRRGILLVVLVAVSGLLLLAGCQQPTPGVTLQSGSRVVRDDATAYIRGGKEVRGSGAVKVLTTRAGDLVGIDVDRSIADRGWSVHITANGANQTTLNSPSLKGLHHFSFNVGSATTDVVVSELAADGSPQGLWAFTIQPTLL